MRGLDYYCHTAFEFVTDASRRAGHGAWAAAATTGLMALMGGPETPGVGWAAGIERLALLIDDPPPAPRPIAIVPVGEKGEAVALQHRARPAPGRLPCRSRLFRQRRAGA